jgi:hypothetical protein
MTGEERWGSCSSYQADLLDASRYQCQWVDLARLHEPPAYNIGCKSLEAFDLIWRDESAFELGL